MSRFTTIIALALVAGAAAAGEQVIAAPEIDPSSAVAGVTLLLGGLTVLRGRMRK